MAFHPVLFLHTYLLSCIALLAVISSRAGLYSLRIRLFTGCSYVVSHFSFNVSVFSSVLPHICVSSLATCLCFLMVFWICVPKVAYTQHCMQ
jgi:hypothetical protein